ncbi:flocculation protein FLO11-like [Cucumis melo var. makuwa]|uniref:Flocculation protein FLO11-like n=1 Tax=Cucumis melo var. makuwa TaxID=1194695 RepID=A0A5A7UK92_CUCMM|nr:flocculation protein FLO11-like [Cucumis melo var. makuwa]
MESINVIMDDLESESMALTRETTYSPPYSDSNRIDMSTPSTPVNHSDLCEGEAALSATKNHPSSSIIGDVHSGIITRKKKRKDYAKMVANEELLRFERNQVWELVPKPPHANIIGTKWIFKNKTDEQGRVIHNKARLVDKRFKLFQMDVKSALINRYLSEEVYVAQPKGFVDLMHHDHVYKLQKALYGLKQAPRACKKKSGIFFSQEKYAKNLISKFGMDKAKPKRTPAATHLKMTKDSTGKKVDTNQYRSIIGNLLYLTASRPDIAFVVGVCARYQVEPRTSHLHSAKCILKYISGCTDDRKSTSGGCFFLGNNIAESMDPAASKGKRYKGISTKHPYKKVCKSILSCDNSAVPNPEQSSHAERSTNPPSLVTVKEEVLEFSSPRSARPFISSFVPKSSSRPEPRVSVETVLLDSDLSDSEDNVASPRTSPPSVADDDDDDSDDEDYAPRMEEKIEAEATFTSTEDQSASHEKDPSDHRTTEEPANVASSSGFRRPSTKGLRVVSTKAGRRKVPPNVPSVPIDGLIRIVSEVGSFYLRFMRELIVNLPSDFNDPTADEYQKVHVRGVCFNVSPELLNTYLGLTLPADYAVSYPTPERLAEELTGGTILVWPVDGQLPVASLKIKYSILHRIRISNWIPSTHASTISTSLGHFVYLVGTGVKVNIGEFIFNHLLRHVDTFAIHIPICLPRILTPRVIPFSMHLFQGAHIPDVATKFDNDPDGTSTPAASHSAVGHPHTLSVSLANRML